jgi:ATP-dependent exoDNAse (exonuclease V) beta subunit
VLSGIIDNQEHTQRVLVGDDFQNIYMWRGSVNAMRDFPAEHRLPLTQSFRFGPAVAGVANKWLSLLRSTLTLRGTDSIPSEICELAAPGAILCRTNATAVAEIIEAQRVKRKVALVGGGKNILWLAQSADDLMRGKRSNHPDLAAFSSWEDVLIYIEEEKAASGELRTLVLLIEKYGIKAIVKAMKTLVQEEQADLIVSTAHKAKGKEFDTVRIASDFYDPAARGGEAKQARATGRLDYATAAEARLAYVAVTRAKLKLDCTALTWADDRLRRGRPSTKGEPVPRSDMPLGDGDPLNDLDLALSKD